MSRVALAQELRALLVAHGSRAVLEVLGQGIESLAGCTTDPADEMNVFSVSNDVYRAGQWVESFERNLGATTEGGLEMLLADGELNGKG